MANVTQNRISIALIEQAQSIIDPVFTNTPQYVCEPLGNSLGCKLALKVETQNPIRCFKGRGADLLVAQSNAPHIVCASAGNFGQAVAYAARKRNVKSTIYASRNANKLKVERMRALGATVVLQGQDFDAAKLAAKEFAEESNALFVEDGLNIETLLGAGTIGLELLTLDFQLDALLIPLGNGALLNGMAKVFKERSPETRIIAVQAASAPAMVESWRAGQVLNHFEANTIADGIAVRLPIEQALADMESLVDDAVLVQESSIRAAMRMLHESAGTVVEPAGAVGVAALIEHPDTFQNKTVGTILCGSNLTRQQMRDWLFTHSDL